MPGSNSRGFSFRFSKQTAILLFLLGGLGLAGVPLRPAQLLRLEQSAEAMGSTYSVAVYGTDEAVMQDAVAQAFEEVQRLDDLLSNYNPNSPWSEVNRFAAERPVKVPPDLFALLEACLDYSRQSEGAFDITVGPLMRVWGFYKGTGHLPKSGEIEGAEQRIGWRNVVLDPAATTVHFLKPGMEIDPGGIGKGYAVDRMVEVLRHKGITRGLVSASGSSIYALGTPPGEAGWPVQIKDPRDPSKVAAEIVLKDQSMSTSGSYEKFFKAEGRVYSHIMDPRTGYPARRMLSVSVISPHTIDSEAWAKPLFINGRSWAMKHKPPGLRAYLCEDKTNQPCVWLQ